MVVLKQEEEIKIMPKKQAAGVQLALRRREHGKL